MTADYGAEVESSLEAALLALREAREDHHRLYRSHLLAARGWVHAAANKLDFMLGPPPPDDRSRP